MPLFKMSPVDAKDPGQLGNWQPQDMSYQAPEIAPRTKFFGEGGTGRAIAGSIGDALLQYGKMEPIYGPQMQAQREAAARAAQAQQQQAAEYAQFVQREQYKAANNEDPYTGHIKALNAVQAGLGDTWAQNAAKNGGSPFAGAFEVNGQRVAPMQGGPTPGTIEDGHRFKGGDPSNPASWEPVSAGGQTPPASGNFPG